MKFEVINKRVINFFIFFLFILLLFPPYEYTDNRIPVTSLKMYEIPKVEHNFLFNNTAKEIKEIIFRGKLDKERFFLEMALLFIISYFLDIIIFSVIIRK